MFTIEFYQTQSGNIPVQDYIDLLIKNAKTAEVAQIIELNGLLQKHGFDIKRYRPKAIKKIQDDIWELRPKSSRVLFFHYENGVFVLLHAFRKQTNKTPKTEIDKAIREIKDYRRRHDEKHN